MVIANNEIEVGRPFLKWVGGKRRLIPALLERLPKRADEYRYVEPFVGGGALYFALQPTRALLADANEPLIRCYESVRDALDVVLEALERLAEKHGPGTYDQARKLFNHHGLDQHQRSALLIYLNRTCFNGLYRVNQSGHFNVPMGRYTNPRILDKEGLRCVSAQLQGADLVAGDFRTTMKRIRKNDLVYLDPPYVGTSETSNFTSYTEDGFGDDTQIALRDAFRVADAKGAKLILSQANHDFVRRLYKGYVIEEVENSRSVSANGGSRGAVTELLVRNFRV
jgi:DNA adenine methylase